MGFVQSAIGTLAVQPNGVGGVLPSRRPDFTARVQCRVGERSGLDSSTRTHHSSSMLG